MKALVKSKSERGLWLADVPEPKAGPNDVLIRVDRTGICGTDLHIYKWDEWAQRTIPVPMHVGHEFVGEVAALGKGVVGQLDAVESLNLRLAHLLKSAVQIAEEQAKSLTAVRALENALQNVQSLSLRLTGLVELGLDLARARDPRELIDLFCRALQDILSSHYAGVVVIGGNGEPMRQFAARGLDDAARERVAREIADCPAAKRVLGQGGVGRLVISLKPSDVTGLPAAHPPVANFLACPAAAHDKAIGWMYVADRLGEGAFSTDDGRIAMALGAQFAIAWDSLGLYTELERQVAQRTRQLEASNRELEAFSYSVSHDLRAPLRAIDGFSRILTEDYGGKVDVEGRRLLDVIRDNSRKMGQLIDDLLEFSRLGRKPLATAEIDMKRMVEEVLEEVQQAGDRRPGVVLGTLPTAHGDVTLVKQAWVNLLSNAVKFSSKRERPVIEVSGRENGAECVYSVKDNGAGFDMKYYDKLFGVFQRLHDTGEFPGTGVGLAIVQRVVTKHGGRVWAEGKVDTGAAFYFTLPKRGAV